MEISVFLGTSRVLFFFWGGGGVVIRIQSNNVHFVMLEDKWSHRLKFGMVHGYCPNQKQKV